MRYPTRSRSRFTEGDAMSFYAMRQAGEPVECAACGNDRAEVNGDDTGADWFECSACGSDEIDRPNGQPAHPTKSEIRSALRAFSRKIHG